MAEPPPQPTRQQKPQGAGCLWLFVAVPVVIVLGLVVGTLASRDDGGPEEVFVTLAEGEADGRAWRVDAKRDVEGDVCAFIYVDDEQLTGACGPVPHDATLADDLTVVFGVAPRDSAGPASAVRVRLSDGEEIELETVTAAPIEGRFYVTTVGRDVDVTEEVEVTRIEVQAVGG